MKCPKCQYLTFENGSSRCRNCGYEFSLTPQVEALDLPIRTGDEPAGPLSDFSLADLDPEPPSRIPPVEPPRQPRSAPVQSRQTPAAALPLFEGDDAPLVKLPAAPRAPVAVRKSAAGRAAQSSPAEEPRLELPPPSRARQPRVEPAPAAGHVMPAHQASMAAGTFPRLLAGAVDLALLLAIDAGVLYFTLELCGLRLAEVFLVPVVPFAAFIALLDGGYLAAFTAAGGQTIGKMIARIRVVPAGQDTWTDRVPFGQAVLRTAGYAASALPLGVGFLPIFVGTERRAVHDRLAGTRVVKA